MHIIVIFTPVSHYFGASSTDSSNGDYCPFKSKEEMLLYILANSPRPVVSAVVIVVVVVVVVVVVCVHFVIAYLKKC